MIKKYLSMKSKKARFDLIRGKSTKGGHYRGIIEQIHGDLWAVPIPAVICRYLLRDMPSLGLKSTHENVLRAIIGNTWNFKKASEFITWEHLLDGKQNPDTGEPIVGGANISRGSLKSAIDNLLRQGIIQRITIESDTGSHILYAPSVWVNGHFIMQPEYGENYWNGSNKDVQFLLIINELFTPILPLFYSESYKYTEEDRFELCSKLTHLLKHPSLLKVFIAEWVDDLHFRALMNNKHRNQLATDISDKKLHPLNQELYQDIRDAVKDDVNESDTDWLSQPEVQGFIHQLVFAKENLDSGTILEDKKAALLQGKILLAMWGKDLITLSSDVWKQWSNLTDLCEDSHLTSTHKEMLHTRQSIPWL